MEEKEESSEILAVGEEAGNNNFRLYITSVCQSRLFAGCIHFFIALCNVALILESVLQDVPLKEALYELDDWTEVQQKLWEDGMSSSWIFTTSFIILVHFLLLRMIFAVYSLSGGCVKIKQKTPTNTATQTKLLSLEQESIARELLQGERDVDIQKDMKKLLKKVEVSVSLHNKTVVTKSWSTTPEYIAQQIALLKKMNKIRTELQALNSEVLLVLKEMLNLRNLPDGVETSN
ncbi:uncharacterized protein LOC130428822 isoform X2 [Triplophysa dalaica]|uniref:uncharacterized protein LOC130428822 isoform X2 n=1 Tax=Triplophysa dalaica TaxID=1582913 RepID=UPI0024DF9F11|nr:uncharacterized protein LOC130428822 isoform X2 [Triplophysa dalaica]